MKKRLVAALLSAVFVLNAVGCGAQQETVQETEQEQHTEEAVQETAAQESSEAEGTGETGSTETVEESGEEEGVSGLAGGYPWIDHCLKENLDAEGEVSAADDFFFYINEPWIRQNEIPDGYSFYGCGTEASLEVQDKATALLTDDTLTGHDAELIQSLYNAFLDWDARNAAGVEPIEGRVQDILSISSLEELSEFISDPIRALYVDTLFDFFNMEDMEDTSVYQLYLYNDGFLLDDAAEYSERTEMGESFYDARLYLTQEMLSRFGYTAEEAKEIFDDVIELETKIAEVALTSADIMGPDYIDLIHNVCTIEEAYAMAPALPLQQCVNQFGYGDAETVCVMEPAVIQRLNELYTEENLEQLKEYMLVNYVLNMAKYLDRPSYDAYMQTLNMIYGSEGSYTDEDMAFDTVRSWLATPMARAYLERYDQTETKERITALCERIIEAYRVMLMEEDWLSEETKQYAIEKLDCMTINAVYPEVWEDYSGLDLNGLSYMEALEEIWKFMIMVDAEKTNERVNTETWDFDILETNAYYDNFSNGIYIVLGYLQDPIYNEDMTEEELLGDIGWVIGHEISHAFDTTGAQFDKDGNFTSWWTDEDYDAFTERAQRLIDYYNSMTEREGEPVIGENIQGEAIADMTGMKVLLMLAAENEDFDYDRFFTKCAISWREITAADAELYYLKQDEHPLSYLRINATLQQFQEFLDTYGIEEGDRMYLAPEDRVLVW